MEKYSRAAMHFLSELAEDVKDAVEESKKDDAKALRNAVNVSSALVDPTVIPKALSIYASEKLGSVQIQEDISAMELFDFLMKHYKTEWFEWYPETITKTILNGKENEIILNKILALATCCKTDTPWLEWHIFENVGKAFNHQVPNFGYIQPLSVGECWVTMKTMEYMRSSEDWSNEVMIYIATVCYANNFVYLPENSVLSKAQDHLDGFGTDLDLKMKTKESWSKIEGRNVLDAEFNEDDPVQVQLAKLSLAQQYMKENTEQ
jgi:hypothetical protein